MRSGVSTLLTPIAAHEDAIHQHLHQRARAAARVPTARTSKESVRLPALGAQVLLLASSTVLPGRCIGQLWSAALGGLV